MFADFCQGRVLHALQFRLLLCERDRDEESGGEREMGEERGGERGEKDKERGTEDEGKGEESKNPSNQEFNQKCRSYLPELTRFMSIQKSFSRTA